MNEREQDARQLLIEIAQCAVAEGLVKDTSSYHSCSKIVQAQKAANWNSFQIPEPWSGDIAHAPILFLSSNPSISTLDAYPKGLCDENHLLSFFSQRFNGYWIRDGRYPRVKS